MGLTDTAAAGVAQHAASRSTSPAIHPLLRPRDITCPFVMGTTFPGILLN
jgi:hypothetical protein